MAEETLPKPAEPSAAATEAAVAESDTKTETETDTKLEEVAAVVEEEKKPSEETPADEAAAEAVSEEAAVVQSESFKEESNIVADLEDPEKKALDEFKQLIQASLKNKEFTPPPSAPAAEETPATKDEVKEEEKPVEEPKTEETEEAKPAEEPKAEEVVSEEVKAEEVTFEEVKTAEVASEEVKKEEEASVSTPQEAKEVEKAVVVEEEGAKTVEAIEETVVPVTAPEEVTPEEPPEEVFLWGVPLVGDEKSDTVLLKFLRARDFKVKDALTMLKNTVIWRKQFGIDSLVEGDLEISELEKVVFNHGLDKEGHPICYNVFGEFQDKELYAKAFGDEEKREMFLRWRLLFLEKGIRQLLDFSPGGISSMLQVIDLKNSPGFMRKDFRVATNKAFALLQDNYPEFVSKQVFINVPWWTLAYYRVVSPLFTPRSKSKMVFVGASKSAETLFKYVAPEQLPVQYGGLSKESDPDFTTADAVTEVTIKPTSKHLIEIPVTEGSLLVWELRVLGWEVSYGAEFVPTAADGYTVIIQKARKFSPADEPYVKNSFKIGEPGKVVLTIDNATSKKKKLLYRYKEKSSTESS